MAVCLGFPGWSWAQTEPAPHETMWTATTADCPSIPEAIAKMAHLVDDVELEQAVAVSETAIVSLACQPEPVSTTVLADLFQMVGVVHLYSRDEAEAERYLSMAVTVLPDREMPTLFGRDALRLYKERQQAMATVEMSSLTVTGDVQAWVDGKEMSPGISMGLLPGTHLVQWKVAEEPMQGKMYELEIGEPRVFRLGPGEDVPIEFLGTSNWIDQPVPPIVASKQLNEWLFLGTGMASILGGSALVYLASRSHERFNSEMDPYDLPELQTRTNSLAASGLVLVASGVAVGGFGIAMSGRF